MKILAIFVLLCVFLVQESIGLLRKPRTWRKNSKRPSKVPSSQKRIKKQTKLSESKHLSTEYSSACTEYYFEQRLDHFSGAVASDGTSTYMQRYFICGQELFNWEENDPIFFYCGNEASVENYIEYTGLMWETASDYHALLVFAEHRFYGESMPWSEDEIYGDIDKLKYAKIDQALEDYAALINFLKKDLNSQDSPVIGFGGSYGGMLAAWFRMKYPMYMDGAIAGSAPIFQIYGMSPASDPYSFSKIETSDASLGILDALSSLVSEDVASEYTIASDIESDGETCQLNLQASWDIISDFSETESGRETLAEIFNLCSTPSDAGTASEVIYVVEEAIAYMAMSSFAYESNYITQAVLGSTTGGLPAYPVSYACANYLSTDLYSDTSVSGKLSLLNAVGSFNRVFWNADESESCVDLDSYGDSFSDYLWDFLYCDSLLMPSGSLGGTSDMFWSDEWDAESTIAWCNEYYGIEFDSIGGAAVKYGGYSLYKSLSNVVFSNGDMDPWYQGGVLPDMSSVLGSSDSLISVLISYNGHHADLMFSDETDSESLVNARAIEKRQITKWIEQSYAKSSVGVCSSTSLWDKLSSHPMISAMNMVL